MITVSSYHSSLQMKKLKTRKLIDLSKVVSKEVVKMEFEQKQTNSKAHIFSTIVLLLLKEYVYDCYQISQCHIRWHNEQYYQNPEMILNSKS